jgi:hypothetical protein
MLQSVGEELLILLKFVGLFKIFLRLNNKLIFL